MDSCPLVLEGRGCDLSKDASEVEVTSLEEAKSVIAALRARQRAQAHQMLAWRRTLKLQVNYSSSSLSPRRGSGQAGRKGKKTYLVITGRLLLLRLPVCPVD